MPSGAEFFLFGRACICVLGQVSYIAAYVMLLVLARLQSFDPGLEEAALDLGANHGQVMRRILLPHLYPAIGAGAAMAFFQSIENFNVTPVHRGGADTLTVYVFSQVRSGITPKINALAFLLILVTLVMAVIYESTAAAWPGSRPRARPRPGARKKR
jgi:spermidine/putrescine transport system permease protein